MRRFDQPFRQCRIAPRREDHVELLESLRKEPGSAGRRGSPDAAQCSTGSSTIRTLSLFAIVSLLVSVAGCSTIPPAKARYEGIQLLRYALETDEPVFSAAYWHGLAKGTLYYDKRFRPPNDPPGPTPVDCINTRRVGVAFVVTRTAPTTTRIITARLRWSHSDVRSGSTGTNWTRTTVYPSGFHRRQRSHLYSSGLNIPDELRVDGIISVRVSVGSNELFQNSFQLIGCAADTQST